MVDKCPDAECWELVDMLRRMPPGYHLVRNDVDERVLPDERWTVWTKSPALYENNDPWFNGATAGEALRKAMLWEGLRG